MRTLRFSVAIFGLFILVTTTLFWLERRQHDTFYLLYTHDDIIQPAPSLNPSAVWPTGGDVQVRYPDGTLVNTAHGTGYPTITSSMNPDNLNAGLIIRRVAGPHDTELLWMDALGQKVRSFGVFPSDELTHWTLDDNHIFLSYEAHAIQQVSHGRAQFFDRINVRTGEAQRLLELPFHSTTHTIPGSTDIILTVSKINRHDTRERHLTFQRFNPHTGTRTDLYSTTNSIATLTPYSEEIAYLSDDGIFRFDMNTRAAIRIFTPSDIQIMPMTWEGYAIAFGGEELRLNNCGYFSIYAVSPSLLTPRMLYSTDENSPMCFVWRIEGMGLVFSQFNALEQHYEFWQITGLDAPPERLPIPPSRNSSFPSFSSITNHKLLYRSETPRHVSGEALPPATFEVYDLNTGENTLLHTCAGFCGHSIRQNRIYIQGYGSGLEAAYDLRTLEPVPLNFTNSVITASPTINRDAAPGMVTSIGAALLLLGIWPRRRT